MLQKLEQTQWLEEKKSLMEDKSSVTLEAIRNLINAGLIVPPTYSVEKNVAELKELEEKINAWEDKAKKVLSGKLVTMYVYRSFIYQIPI